MPLLTKEQAAKELCIPVRRLDRWRWHGIGPAYVQIEKEVRYDPADVHAYITANRRRPAAQTFLENVNGIACS